MLVFPNSKINIGLNVLRKRSDGYHDLQSIFYPVCIEDALEVLINQNLEKIKFTNTGLKIDAPIDKNLVVKACNKLKERYDLPAIEIFLHKKIPFGAGLGGGSADASFMLKLLNNLFKLNLTDEELRLIAAEICADCPFFIHNKPALVTGIGEKIEPLDDFLEGYKILLVKPQININTSGIYKQIEPDENVRNLKELVKMPIETWEKYIFNDFENVIFKQYPQILQIKAQLYENGALYASMSGSGSTVYGIFDKNTIVDKKAFKGNFLFECEV